MFSGIVRCADCGEKLYYCTSKNFEARQDHFVCSTSRLKGKEVCSTHFIRAVVLEQGVLAHMRLTIACVANHEEQFRKAMGAKQKAEAKKELAAKRRQLTQAERRIEELDRLFKRIYEDNVGGKLSSVNDCLVGILKHKPLFLWIVTGFLAFVGLLISLEIYRMPLIFWTLQNVSYGIARPVIGIVRRCVPRCQGS